MKTYKKTQSLIASAAMGITVVAASMPSTFAAEQAGKDSEGFIEQMDRWQEKMSEKFRDTWKSLRKDARHESVATASVDLREDKNGYTLRLNLPDRDLDKVEIKLVGEILRIVAPTAAKVGRYEQTVSLAGVDGRSEPKVERRPEDEMIVITVPKGRMMPETKPSLPLAEQEQLVPFSEWDHDIFDRMEKMRRDMDSVFENAFRQFRTAPEHEGFFDEPRFGSSLDLKEEGDAYTIRAYLPDRSMQKINVTIEDRTLKIEATEQDTAKKEGDAGTLHSTRKAAYTQFVTIPGLVQSDKMKVDKKEGMLVITLPKAK